MMLGMPVHSLIKTSPKGLRADLWQVEYRSWHASADQE